MVVTEPKSFVCDVWKLSRNISGCWTPTLSSSEAFREVLQPDIHLRCISKQPIVLFSGKQHNNIDKRIGHYCKLMGKGKKTFQLGKEWEQEPPLNPCREAIELLYKPLKSITKRACCCGVDEDPTRRKCLPRIHKPGRLGLSGEEHFKTAYFPSHLFIQTIFAPREKKVKWG